MIMDIYPDILRTLVSIPSVSCNEEAAAAFLGTVLDGMGIAHANLGGNLVAINAKSNPSRPTLALDAHIDTVPANAGYTCSPFDSGNDPETSYGGVSPLSALIANYDSIADDVPKVRARAAGAEHEQMLMRSDGYMTAWMLYQLTGDEEAGSVFLGENAEILHNANWQDVEKNH